MKRKGHESPSKERNTTREYNGFDTRMWLSPKMTFKFIYFEIVIGFFHIELEISLSFHYALPNLIH